VASVIEWARKERASTISTLAMRRTLSEQFRRLPDHVAHANAVQAVRLARIVSTGRNKVRLPEGKIWNPNLA